MKKQVLAAQQPLVQQHLLANVGTAPKKFSVPATEDRGPNLCTFGKSVCLRLASQWEIMKAPVLENLMSPSGDSSSTLSHLTSPRQVNSSLREQDSFQTFASVKESACEIRRP